jgi:hypothetical protein
MNFHLRLLLILLGVYLIANGAYHIGKQSCLKDRFCTSGSVEPVWPTTSKPGQITQDSTCVWSGEAGKYIREPPPPASPHKD